MLGTCYVQSHSIVYRLTLFHNGVISLIHQFYEVELDLAWLIVFTTVSIYSKWFIRNCHPLAWAVGAAASWNLSAIFLKIYRTFSFIISPFSHFPLFSHIGYWWCCVFVRKAFILARTRIFSRLRFNLYYMPSQLRFAFCCCIE